DPRKSAMSCRRVRRNPSCLVCSFLFPVSTVELESGERTRRFASCLLDCVNAARHDTFIGAVENRGVFRYLSLLEKLQDSHVKSLPSERTCSLDDFIERFAFRLA